MFFCLATAFQLGARTQVTHTHSTSTRDPAAGGVGAEHLSIRGTAEDMVEGPAIGTPYGLRRRVACNARWRARSRAVAGRRGALAHLRADGKGNWQDGGGQVIEALRGCVDIDTSATLLANTLRNDI